MLRNALAAIVQDRGSAETNAKGDLKDRVKALIAEGELQSAMGDWATHVRLYGNAGAHPELFGPVNMDEARDVERLTRTLIEQLYVIPATITRRRAERET